MTIERLGEVVDAEIIPSKVEVLQQIERAIQFNTQGNAGHASFWDVTIWIADNHAWLALDFDSLGDLWEARFSHLEVVAPRSVRGRVVESFRRAGLTQQEIADKLGVSQKTVSNVISNFTNDDQPASITNSRGQSRPATYKKKEKEVPAPAVEDTRAHKSPFAEGTKLTPDTDRTVILVGADGRAYTGAPDTQKAIEYARENPRVANWEAAKRVGVSTSTVSRAYGALRKNGEIPATGHTERSMADMFDLIAIGARNVGTSIDMYADRISEAEPDDFDYYWEEFDQAVKKINSFRREIKRIHNL